MVDFEGSSGECFERDGEVLGLAKHRVIGGGDDEVDGHPDAFILPMGKCGGNSLNGFPDELVLRVGEAASHENEIEPTE